MIHKHDDLYYTQEEAVEKFYSRQEFEALLREKLYALMDANLILVVHEHPDIYYSKTEMNTLFCRFDTPITSYVERVDTEALKEFL